MSDLISYHDPLDLKKNGCWWVVVILGAVGGLIILASPFLIDLLMTRNVKLVPATVIKDIRVAITSYEVDYEHFPIPDSESNALDATIRSRGPILTALMGNEATPLNPRGIKFIDLPLAKNRKFGLWQDGREWVLSDLWGEPYYIILDTNGDLAIANPEFGAEISDPRHAEFYQKHPQPETLPLRVAIYSSGPDRDPKTWKDNVWSWRSR